MLTYIRMVKLNEIDGVNGIRKVCHAILFCLISFLELFEFALISFVRFLPVKIVLLMQQMMKNWQCGWNLAIILFLRCCYGSFEAIFHQLSAKKRKNQFSYPKIQFQVSSVVSRDFPIPLFADFQQTLWSIFWIFGYHTHLFPFLAKFIEFSL